MTMEYAGVVSTFSANLPCAEKGVYTLRILASNTKSANFAMYESELVVK